MLSFLTRTRGRVHGKTSLHWTDWVSYAYLLAGLIVMFGPVLWLIMSSFKTESALSQFPPTFLPYSQKEVVVAGYDKPLPLFMAKDELGQVREMAQVLRIGIMATLVDPVQPQTEIKVNIKDRQPVNELKFASGNYTELFGKFKFGTYLWNSVFITVVATLLTLLFNSMAAFALSKYQFTGQKTVFVLIIATLMIPPTIILVPAFLVISSVGLLNNLWGVILPAVATPTGVFLLRQYMLTIPDELLEAARMDNASEWRIYWRIILPSLGPVFFSTLMVVSHLAIKSFDLVMALTAGGPGYATDLPATFMYATAFTRGQIGVGAASATVMLATVAAIVVPYLYSELRSKR
jgi:alpha-1,4-digalacturonate transport system permease protein